MDAAELRAAQAPLKERFRADPGSATTPVTATGDWSEPGITATIEGFAGPVRAGLHSATGGDGSDACSGDLLMQALLACAGVTLRSVATALGIDVRRAELVAESSFDARGTLGIDRSVPVGIGPVVVTAVLDTDADDAQLAKLAELTGRYCVVGQSLREEPVVEIRRAGRRRAG
ncbi:peroxiredoxin [Nocardioides phosphati]|uniref:Peroxiredoxin n=1 Tax=Nocardioides phosphati TaxID=1867775 RepID=A0ABQ2N852_9ACTN|nr:OsmC family protein [Nocardioides phosphati]GGO87323.1 peroxiredoxin [Nocardioides phosphati]